MQLIKKFFSALYSIWAFIFVTAFLIAAITIMLNTNFYLGLFIFLILGIIIVYLIKRGRRFDSKDKSSPSTCSLCEGQGRVRSKTKWFLSLESSCPICEGKGYSDTNPSQSDKNKYKPINNSGDGFFGFVGVLIFFAIILSFQYKRISPNLDRLNFSQNLELKKRLIPPDFKFKFDSEKFGIPKKYTVIKSGKKELYDFCEKEGFNTTDKGIKECGLLINKRLLEANINPTEIDTSQETEQILNKLEEQGKIIKKMEQREKFKKAINVYKAYKKLGLF